MRSNVKNAFLTVKKDGKETPGAMLKELARYRDNDFEFDAQWHFSPEVDETDIKKAFTAALGNDEVKKRVAQVLGSKLGTEEFEVLLKNLNTKLQASFIKVDGLNKVKEYKGGTA